ncbi:hypothetical protein MKX01_003410 [Papaver californicum]|nr:hypothetical protein MKX01_003410 [Papaver californicum]
MWTIIMMLMICLNNEVVVCDLEMILKIGSKVRKRTMDEWCHEVRHGGKDDVIDRRWENRVHSSHQLWKEKNEEEQRREIDMRWKYLEIYCIVKELKPVIIDYYLSINRLVLDRGSYSDFSLPRQTVNGLLYITTSRDDAFLIYNLITGEKSPWIETNKQAGNCIAFRFNPQSGEHEVICISSIAEVFTVGKNTWRRIDAIPPIAIRYDQAPFYVDGRIYWRFRPDMDELEELELILRFDIVTEKFIVIPTPDFIVDPERHKFTQIIHEDGNIEWTEEIIDMPPHWNGKPDLSIEALTGTNLIFLHYGCSDSIFLLQQKH